MASRSTFDKDSDLALSLRLQRVAHILRITVFSQPTLLARFGVYRIEEITERPQPNTFIHYIMQNIVDK